MIHENKPADMILKGTTTIGIVCSNGVALATDTRATMGYFVAHKKAKKVYKIYDKLAMTIAGTVADAQAVVETLKANAQLYFLEKGRAMPVKSAARLVANLLFSSRYIPLSLQALVAGVDESGSHIYALDPFGSVTEEKCVSTGSGSPIAYGLLESEYRENLSIDDGVSLIVRAVHSAMKRDSASGDSFDVAIITDEGYRELSDEEKKRLAQ